MSQKFYVDESGNYKGSFVDGAIPPDGLIEVDKAPDDARQKWDGEKWLPYDKPREQKIAEALQPTEKTADLARKLEDITAYIVNGTALPVNPDTGKSYAGEWLETRKAERSKFNA